MTIFYIFKKPFFNELVPDERMSDLTHLRLSYRCAYSYLTSGSPRSDRDIGRGIVVQAGYGSQYSVYPQCPYCPSPELPVVGGVASL